jgi:hypothetical protein
MISVDMLSGLYQVIFEECERTSPGGKYLQYLNRARLGPQMLASLILTHQHEPINRMLFPHD